MIKIHKLEDGDIIKILPSIDKDDKITWCRQYTCAVVNKQSIYDNSDKQYLRRISHGLYRSDYNIKLPVQIRFAYNVYIGGEIKIINVGRTIQDIITNNPEVLDIRSNKHLKIVAEMKSGFLSFDKSHIGDHNWAPPVSDIDSKEEWYSYIKTNQPDFDNHIESNNIFVHKQKLVEFLGRDMLGHLIADDRQKKLDNLGI